MNKIESLRFSGLHLACLAAMNLITLDIEDIKERISENSHGQITLSF